MVTSLFEQAKGFKKIRELADRHADLGLHSIITGELESKKAKCRTHWTALLDNYVVWT